MERITEKRRQYGTFFAVNERKKCVGKLNTVPFISISHIETKNFKCVKVDDIKIYLNGIIKFNSLWSYYQYYREDKRFPRIMQKLIFLTSIARHCIKSRIYYNQMKDDAYDILQGFLPEEIQSVTASDLRILSGVDNMFTDSAYKMVINKDPYEGNEVYEKLSLVEPIESDVDWMRPFLKISKDSEDNFVKYTMHRDGNIIFHDKKTKFDIMGEPSDMSWLMRVANDIVEMEGITPDSLKDFPKFDEYITAELRAFPSYV